MSRKRTIFASLALLLAVNTPATAQMPLFETFASCTGRLSAQMEHAWLMNDPAADALETQRLTFVSLLDAVTPEADRKAALNHRIEAKMAHAALLTTADFGTDTQRANWAKRQSHHHLSICQRLLLDS